jgi:hypothetical protein
MEREVWALQWLHRGHPEGSPFLEQTLRRLLLLYNEHLSQSALSGKTPMDVMNMWFASHPQRFLHTPGSNRPGHDIIWNSMPNSLEILMLNKSTLVLGKNWRKFAGMMS